MTRTGLVLFGLAATSPVGAAQEATDQCSACHARLDDPGLSEPALGFEADVHAAAGLPCAGCHGGDSASEVEQVAHRGMLARPPRPRSPELCGRCHSNAELIKRFNPDLRVDQVDRYRTSVHGTRLSDFGDTKVATCVDCHGAHGILPPSDDRSKVHPRNIPDLCGSCHADADYMAEYGIATDQLAEYGRSVHWQTLSEEGDLSAPVCNDCHGNHGAAPPGYASVGRVCAECHFQIGQYYAASPHDTVFSRLGEPDCATCHENHAILEASDEVLGLGKQTACQGSGCHSTADEGGRVAAAMEALVDSLRTRFERADSILLAAEHAGMQVSQAQFELNQARSALVAARAIAHTASLDSVAAHVEEGLTIVEAGYAAGEAAFEELENRRLGLAVSSAVILVLIVGLVLKIRQAGGGVAFEGGR